MTAGQSAGQCVISKYIILIPFIIIILLAFLEGIISWMPASSNHPSVTILQPDPFSQSNFPCEEDEALIFVTSLSNDRTGCVHLDMIGIR